VSALTTPGIEGKAARIVDWMRETSAEAGAKGGVFGVSGGVDSALILALAKKAWPETCMGLVLPCHSPEEDADDAVSLLDLFHCPYRIVDLTETYDTLLKVLPDERLPSLALARANLKPRLRMMMYYYHANLLKFLVVGTSNRDELYVGYFTKHGDSGVDIIPLASLTKGEVREMSRHLGVPERIVDKAPSAGLWQGQTDEGEMGLLYRDLDAYLLGRDVPPEVRERIERRHKASEHKRTTPPYPDLR
jgi:NAD+ synthase